MGLGNLFSDANERRGAEAAQAGYSGGMGYAKASIDQSKADAQRWLAEGRSQYWPSADRYNQGSSAYADALGLNGQAGADNARGMFHVAPGYDWMVDQALQQVDRRASAQGQLGSGQTGLDTVRTAYGLADQGYNNWLDRLGGYDSKLAGNLNSQSNMYQAQAATDSAAGAAKAGYDWLGYSSIGNSQNEYEKGLDATGANILGAITGGLSLGAKILGLGGFGAPTGGFGG
jgi:hypothetical protein